jgi:hypothetical protein
VTGPRLLAVEVGPEAVRRELARQDLIEIRFSDIEIRVPIGVEANYLAALVVALRSRC